MVCRRCGYTYSDRLDECPICDEPREAPAQSALPVPGTEMNAGTDTIDVAVPGVGDAMPLILGVLGFIGIIGLVPAILAVIFGRRASTHRLPGSAAHMLGQVGYRLGIVGLIFQACVTVYLILVVQAVIEVASAPPPVLWAAM